MIPIGKTVYSAFHRFGQVKFDYGCSILDLHAFHRVGKFKFSDGGWFDLKLKPIFTTSPAASKFETWHQNGKKWLEKNNLDTLI